MQKNKKKRGRPCQNRPAIDQGTLEFQSKRASLFAEGLVKDPALAESLLGIFYGRQLISASLYKAGVSFGELAYKYEPCLGHKFRQYSSTLLYKNIERYGDSPDLWTDQCHEKRALAWQNALSALKKAGKKPYKTVMTVVFYNQDLYLTPLSNRMLPLVQPLQQGLASLEAYFKGDFQDRRHKPCDQEQNPGKATIFQPVSKEHPPDFLA